MKILDHDIPDEDIRNILELFEDFAYWCVDEKPDPLAVFYVVSLEHAILCNRLAARGYSRDMIVEVLKIATDKAIKYTIQYNLSKVIDP